MAQGGGGALLLALSQQPVTHGRTPAGRCLHPPATNSAVPNGAADAPNNSATPAANNTNPCSTDATPGTAGTVSSGSSVSSAGTTGTASSGTVAAPAASVHNIHRTLVRPTDNIWTPPTATNRHRGPPLTRAHPGARR